MQPLREEVETIIAKEGWTKAALMKMWKLDSFMKESQRFNGIVSSTSLYTCVDAMTDIDNLNSIADSDRLARFAIVRRHPCSSWRFNYGSCIANP